MPSDPPNPTSTNPADLPTIGLPEVTASPLAGPVPAASVSVPGYTILGELGRGGMGVVYKARQSRLNRIVALKMILSGAHAGEAERQRFLTEAEAVARLSHPNIVQIHEIGECNGLPFFSLEFCSGGSLADRLQGVPMPATEAVALVESLARAIHHAHAQGVVHRDLKPANILLATPAGSDHLARMETLATPSSSGSTPSPHLALVPKVTDFGLAKKLDSDGHTATGTILGTPSYMAPEQARGDSRAIQPATDLYALGAILYELLTGRPPFRAATAMETIFQVLHNEPVALTQLQPGLSKDLETICLKCLQKDPARRYVSALDLVEDLRRWQEGEPIKARPIGVFTRLGRWCARHPAVAGLLLLVVFSLVILFLNLRSSLASVERLARNNQRLLAQSLAARLDERLLGSQQAVALLSRESEIRLLLTTPRPIPDRILQPGQEALQNVLLSNPDFSSAFVLAANGVAVASTNPAHPGHSYAFRDYYREAIRGQMYRSKIIVGTSTGQAGLYYSAPVLEGGGKVIGVVVVKLEAEAISRIVEGLELGERSGAFLVDDEGIIIAHPDRSQLYRSVRPLTEEEQQGIASQNRFQKQTIETVDEPALARLAGNEEAGSLDYVDRGTGTRRILAFAPMKEQPWIVALDLDTRDFTGERILLLRRSSMGIAVIAGILVLAVLGLLVRRMQQRRASTLDSSGSPHRS